MAGMSNEDRPSLLLGRLMAYPSIQKLARAQLHDWPDHVKVLEKSLADDDPAFLARTDALAELVWKLVGEEIELYCADYHWMCIQFMEEQLFFRRNHRYRLQTFAEANAEIYGQISYMRRYVHGILLSQVFWRNHARAIDLFRTRFLPDNRRDYDHLDVGPGHGLFLAYAAGDSNCGSINGWDVSESSIKATEGALSRMGIERPVSLILQDVLQAPPEAERFDSVIISEVLEHLERPDAALGVLYSALRRGGRIFINVPVNSPAPDHIFLWRHPDEITALVEGQGLKIDESYTIPVTGKTMEEAIKQNIDISCVVIAHK